MNNPYESDAAPCGGDILSCLPLSAACTQVLRRLRAPALHVQYSMDKQVIPDLDAARGTASDTGQSGTQACSPACTQDSGQDTQSAGQPENIAGKEQNTVLCTAQSAAPCSMREQGSFTVRLFDLAVGGVLVMATVCLLKCCGGVKRMCRRWF